MTWKEIVGTVMLSIIAIVCIISAKMSLVDYREFNSTETLVIVILQVLAALMALTLAVMIKWNN